MSDTVVKPATKVAPTTAGPFGAFERMVAMRYLGATKNGAGISLISIIAFLGITLAVAVLIVVMSVMQGFRAKLIDQLLGVDAHFYVKSAFGTPLSDPEAIAERLRQVDGVISAMPAITVPAYAAGNEGESAALVHGVPPKDIYNIEYVTGPDNLVAGSFEGFGEGKFGGNKIAIAYGLANTLHVWEGDSIKLISGAGADTPFGSTPRSKFYEIAAVFKIGNSEYDSYFIYMPLEQTQLFFNKHDGADQVEVRVKDPEHIERIEQDLQNAAGPETRGFSWKVAHQSYYNALEIERRMMRVVLSMIVLIAFMLITIGLVMQVKDKNSDIAILRTMGGGRGSVLRIFFLSGAFIGIIGTLCGLLLGAVISLNIGLIEKTLSQWFGIRLFSPDIYLFDSMPAQMDFNEVLFVVLMSIILSFVATLYPAWRASKLDPVEALRYE